MSGTDEELDKETLWWVLDRLGGDVYCQPKDSVTWKEVFGHVQFLERRAYIQGRADGKAGV